MSAPRAIAAHKWDRESHEHYVEPEWCSRRLFDVEKFEGPIWDPACGFGRIVESARNAGLAASGSDIISRASDYGSLDFFTSLESACNIISNPPFNIAREFILHALKITTGKVAAIFPTARLNAAHWLEPLPLARVWLLTPRPSMPPGHMIARGEKPGGGKVDFCWLVFDHNRPAVREINWLHREPQ